MSKHNTVSTYKCPACGSPDIEEQVVVWVDPNCGEVTDGEWMVVPWDNRYSCNSCNHRFNEPDTEQATLITAEERFVVRVAGLNERMPTEDAAEWVLAESHDTLRRLIEAARQIRNAKEES